MKYKILVPVALSIAILSGSAVAQNYKIRQVTSMNGQKIDSAVYVRGARKRTEGGAIMGYGGDVATIEECDLKQTVKINDKKRMYSVDPFDTDVDLTSSEKAPTTPVRSEPRTKGGTVTYVSNITDTGERKQMFGMTARHVKTSMSIEASPDACGKQDMKAETDGWYIDLPEFSCPVNVRPPMPPMGGQRGGCQDKVQFRHTGSGKIGFPLQETQTISMGGGMSFTRMLETIEFSKAPLEASLFDIPQGYTRAANSQDLYDRPDISAMMRNAGATGDMDNPAKQPNNPMPVQVNPMSNQKRPGSIRIGVLVPSNRGGETVSTVDLQEYLIERLMGGNVEAVAVNSEADARSANCDYVLTSDFSRLKQSTASKIGGVFGKVTNTDTSGSRNFEAQVDYKLVKLANGQQVVQNKASSKAESSAESAAKTALSQEAQTILSAAGKP